MNRSVLVLALGLAGSCSTPPAAPVPPAVPTPEAARLLPADYQGELWIDWARMRDIELLDRLLRLPMAEATLEVIAADYGGDLESLKSVRTAFVDARDRDVVVSIVEFAGETASPSKPEIWTAAPIGPHAGFRRGHGASERAIYWTRPGQAMHGQVDAVTALATGHRATGGPHRELAAMLAGEGILLQLAYGRFGHPYDEVLRTFGSWFGNADDPVDFVRFRLQEERDGQLVASVALRYQHGTTGLRSTEQMVHEKVDAQRADPRFVGLRPFLADIVITHVGRDLIASLRLGPPRQAVTTVEQVMLAMTAMMQAENGR
ncbi:MAG: hypothetical protein IPK26_03505 [Planctomycetes bacterium]|nr:hypothetical protein [Planctomycetota bacterium]